MRMLLPAVLIGGPPRSGKSVLSYTLHRALRKRWVQHYLYRACPDGEGDWFHEGREDTVRAIRIKGKWTADYAEFVSCDLRQRLLPLLVDIGGKPGSFDPPIFRACTHAIVLTKTEEDHERWVGLVEQYGLDLIADLHSQLHGQTIVETTHPVIRGTMSGLERHQPVVGPLVDLLVERLAGLLSVVDVAQLRRMHLAEAPAGHLLELDLLCPKDGKREPGHWLPQDLPGLQAYLAALPPAERYSLYGVAPLWVYGLVAATLPATLSLFDVRLGWVAAPVFPQIASEASEGGAGELRWKVRTIDGATALQFQAQVSYLDYRQSSSYTLPSVPNDRGLFCSGQLPLWVWAALGRHYRSLPWLAFYQPTLEKAVVVASRDEEHPIGSQLNFTPLLQ